MFIKCRKVGVRSLLLCRLTFSPWSNWANYRIQTHGPKGSYIAIVLSHGLDCWRSAQEVLQIPSKMHPKSDAWKRGVPSNGAMTWPEYGFTNPSSAGIDPGIFASQRNDMIPIIAGNHNIYLIGRWESECIGRQKQLVNTHLDVHCWFRTVTLELFLPSFAWTSHQTDRTS